MKSTSHSVKSDRLRCPLCSEVYEQGDIHIVFQERAKRIVHVTCPKCESSLFLSLEAHPFGMVGVGVPTDLSYAEAITASKRHPITADTVIEVYRALYADKKAKGKKNVE